METGRTRNCACAKSGTARQQVGCVPSNPRAQATGVPRGRSLDGRPRLFLAACWTRRRRRVVRQAEGYRTPGGTTSPWARDYALDSSRLIGASNSLQFVKARAACEIPLRLPGYPPAASMPSVQRAAAAYTQRSTFRVQPCVTAVMTAVMCQSTGLFNVLGCLLRKMACRCTPLHVHLCGRPIRGTSPERRARSPRTAGSYAFKRGCPVRDPRGQTMPHLAIAAQV